MTHKDINLTLATLTFLVQSLLRHQTTALLKDIRRELSDAYEDKKLGSPDVSHDEVRASVESFLSALK